ncbi:hypothetical protein F4861DRAFT_197432 [Xylaria intraflava]|nr:hypothetical protein F4861DRAFT_197432 [Xylaria intraflava]
MKFSPTDCHPGASHSISIGDPTGPVPNIDSNADPNRTLWSGPLCRLRTHVTSQIRPIIKACASWRRVSCQFQRLFSLSLLRPTAFHGLPRGSLSSPTGEYTAGRTLTVPSSPTGVNTAGRTQGTDRPILFYISPHPRGLPLYFYSSFPSLSRIFSRRQYSITSLAWTNVLSAITKPNLAVGLRLGKSGLCRSSLGSKCLKSKTPLNY